MRQRCRVIYNPTSGREIMRNNLVDILDILENAGYETSTYATTPEPDSAKNEANRCAKDGFDLIVAAGGDGTINEVVNGISPLEKRPKMGIIPAGTTNDYARALGISRDSVIEAAKVIAKGETLKADIGKAGKNYFMNIAAAGSLTELTYSVPSRIKSLFGYAAYFAKGVELLPQIKPVNVHLEFDGGTYDGEISMFFLALTNSVGGFEQIVPDAELDDGKFTLIIVKSSNVMDIMQIMTKALAGKHVDDPRIIYVKTSKFVAWTHDDSDKMMVNLDGEYGGDTPMEFTDLKQHIEMFANLEEIGKDTDDGLDEIREKFTEDVDRYSKDNN